MEPLVGNLNFICIVMGNSHVRGRKYVKPTARRSPKRVVGKNLFGSNVLVDVPMELVNNLGFISYEFKWKDEKLSDGHGGCPNGATNEL